MDSEPIKLRLEEELHLLSDAMLFDISFDHEAIDKYRSANRCKTIDRLSS